MNAPDNVFRLFKELAKKNKQCFSPVLPSVRADGYDMLFWDDKLDAVIYDPAMDEGLADKDNFGASDFFIISEDELQRMLDDESFVPALDRPIA